MPALLVAPPKRVGCSVHRELHPHHQLQAPGLILFHFPLPPCIFPASSLGFPSISRRGFHPLLRKRKSGTSFSFCSSREALLHAWLTSLGPQPGDMPPSYLVGLKTFLWVFPSGGPFGGCLHRGLLPIPIQYQVHLGVEFAVPWGHPSGVGWGSRPIGSGD